MRRIMPESYAELPPDEQPFRRPHSYEAADAAVLLRDSGMATPMPKPRASIAATKPTPGERFAGPSTPEAVARPKPTVRVQPTTPGRPNVGAGMGRLGDRMRPRRRY
jgi:hypothetical protein